MALTWGAILPHGGQTIPGLGGKEGERFAATRHAMEAVADAVRNRPVDAIVLATPHGIRAEGAVTVSDSEFTEGHLSEGSSTVNARYRVDRVLARRIRDAALEAGLDAPLLSYGASSGPASCLPLDWGAQVPLHFVAPPAERAPAVVTLCPSRALSFADLARFGEAVARAAEGDTRIAFIASADQCHAHRADGPYGYDPAAAELDAVIVEAVRADRLEDLFGLNPAVIAAGKPDSLWQMAMLVGVRRHVLWHGHFVGYDVPTYFGMLSAYYLPDA